MILFSLFQFAILLNWVQSEDIIQSLLDNYPSDEIVWAFSTEKTQFISVEEKALTFGLPVDCSVSVTVVEDAGFVWELEKSEMVSATFLQVDMKLVRQVTKINTVISVLPAPSFNVSFSLGGLTWFNNVDLVGCATDTLDIKARYVRFYIKESGNVDAQAVKISFVIEGNKASSYEPIQIHYHTKACHGFQARIDVDYVGSDVTADICTKDNVKVFKKEIGGGELDETLFEPDALDIRQTNSFNAVAEYIESYNKCIVTLSFDAFQSDWNGEYRIEAADSKISSSATFEVEDDGEEDFFINSTIGNLFVTAVAYDNYNSVEEKFERVEEMKKKCKDEKNADLFKTDDIDAVQIGNTNSFLQSVIYDFLAKRTSEDIAELMFVMSYSDGDEKCSWVNSNTGLIETDTCSESPTIGGLLCYSVEGEIRSVNLTNLGCEADPNGKGVVMSYNVSADVVGCFSTRKVTCKGKDDGGRDIESTQSEHLLNCSNYALFEIASSPEKPVVAVECKATRYMVLDLVTTVATFDSVKLPQDDPKLEFDKTDTRIANNKIYLEKTDYETGFEIKMNYTSFLFQEVIYKFKEFGDEVGVVPDFMIITNRQTMVCENDAPVLLTDYTAVIENLSPAHSGLYEFEIIEQNSSSLLSLELIHPYSLECSSPCMDALKVGEAAEFSCDLELQVITNFVDLDNEDSIPIDISYSKEGPDEYNLCEYSVPLDKPLLRNDFPQENFLVDTDTRKLTFNFRVFSVQPWNTGLFSLLVKPSQNLDHCNYQSKDGNCVPQESASSCSNDPKSTVQSFRINIAHSETLGSASFRSDLCGPEIKGMFFNLSSVFGEEASKYKYYYRLCELKDVKDLNKVCGADTGSFILDSFDFLFRLITNQQDNHNYDAIDVFKALTCNSLIAPQDPFKLNFVFANFSGVNRLRYKFDGTKLDLLQDSPNSQWQSVLCRYRRGKASIEPIQTDCKYKKLPDPEAELAEEDKTVFIHGNVPVSISCTSVPADSSPDQTFYDITENFPLDAKIGYSKPETEAYSCCQIYPTEMNDERTECTDFPITSKVKYLEVREKIVSDNFWCGTAENNFGAQPCYGKQVTLSCCVDASPLSHCDWSIKMGEVDQLENNARGISWSLHSKEETPCYESLWCSNLTFSPLQKSHKGFYYCECFSGLEGTFLESPYRSVSKMFQVNEQQSQYIGFLQDAIQFKTVCGSNAKFYGTLEILGNPVIAKIKCRDTEVSTSEYQYLNNDKIQVGQDENKTLNLISFDLSQTRRSYKCVIEIQNQGALDLPPFEITKSLSKAAGVQSSDDLVVYRDTSNPEYTTQPLKVCCSFCEFDIQKASDIRLFCATDGSSKNLETTSDANDFEFDSNTYRGTKCVQLTESVQNSVSCTCFVRMKPEFKSGALFRADGLIQPIIYTTQPPTEPTKAPEPEKAAETTPQTTTQAKSLKRAPTLFPQVEGEPDSNTTISATYEDSLKLFNKLIEVMSETEKITREQFKEGFGVIKGLLNTELRVKLQSYFHKPSQQEVDKSINALTKEVITYVEEMVSKYPEMASMSTFMTTQISELQDVYFHIGKDLKNGSRVEHVTKDSHVAIVKVPSDEDELGNVSDVSLLHFDSDGITLDSLV